MHPRSPATRREPMEAHFRAYIERSRRIAVNPDKEDRSFVPFSALKVFFTEERTGAFLRDTTGSSHRIQPRTVVKRFLRVYSILISIGKAIYFPYFYRDDRFDDERLPFTNEHDWHENCKPFFTKFYAAQWQFCAREFHIDWMNDTRLDDELILPIEKLECLKSGTDSSTYKIQLHSEHNRLERVHQFVLKSCKGDKANIHHDEVSAYQALSTQTDVQPHLARFYGSWLQGDRCNILLEYVEGGDLTNFLFTTEPPYTAEETIKFWKAFLEVAKPLARIHSPDYLKTGLQGIHHNIKLDSFLVTPQSGQSRFDVAFKLVDLGLTDIKNLDAEEAFAVLNRVDTQTYSSPENFTDEANDFLLRTVQGASRSKDIWALGCVFSQVAVWSVLGYKELLTYQNVRTEAIRKIPKLRSTAHSECFHNGDSVLPEVMAYHKRVCQSKRNVDDVTHRVLELVREMLYTNSEDRPSAHQVVKRCHGIIKQAEDLLPTSVNVPEDERYPDFFKTGRPLLSTPQGLGLESVLSMGSPANGWPTPRYPSNVSPMSFRIQPSELPHLIPTTPSFSHRSHHPNPSLDAIVSTSINTSTPVPNSSQRVQYSSASPGEKTEMNSNGQPVDRRHSVPNITPNTPKMKQNKRVSAPLLLQPTLEAMVDRKAKITVDEVIDWINNKKSGMKQPLPHFGLLKMLNGRDQIFLVDDSESMRPHWNDVKKTFRALAYLVKMRDLDEIELFFTNDTGIHGRSKNTRPLLKILNQTKPDGVCEIGVAFERILDGLDFAHRPEAKKDFGLWNKKKKENVKYGTTIYILTDAVWQDGWKEGIVHPIKTFMEKHLKKGQLGVQFIQFGKSLEGSERLDILGRGLSWGGVPKDIFDTEPWDGNVLKMLLGSFDQTWNYDQRPGSQSSSDTVIEESTLPAGNQEGNKNGEMNNYANSSRIVPLVSFESPDLVVEGRKSFRKNEGGYINPDLNDYGYSGRFSPRNPLDTLDSVVEQNEPFPQHEGSDKNADMYSNTSPLRIISSDTTRFEKQNIESERAPLLESMPDNSAYLDLSLLDPPRTSGRKMKPFNLEQRQEPLFPHSLLDEIQPIERDRIWFEERRSLRIRERFQNWVEDVTDLDWDWWPMSPSVRALESGQSRVRWQCFCGIERNCVLDRTQTEQLKKALAKKPKLTDRPLLCALRVSARTKSQPAAQNQSTLPTSTSTQSAGFFSSSLVLSTRNDSSKSHSRSSSISLHSSIGAGVSASSNTSGQSTSQQHRFCMLFGVEGSRTTLEWDQIDDVDMKSDPVFMRHLRRRHNQMRGWMRLHFSVWQLTHWEFTKFHRMGVADRIADDGPGLPETSDYEYTRPSVLSKHDFEIMVSSCISHCWRSPFEWFHDCKALEEPMTWYVDGMPKRNRDFIAKGGRGRPGEYIWGIHARYKVSFRHVIAIHMIIVVVTFGGIGGWWLEKHPGDLQNAAVPITVAGICLSAFWGSFGLLKDVR